MLIWLQFKRRGPANGAVYPNRTDCRLYGCHSVDRYRLLRLARDDL
jgi:hypothetical protein